MERNRSLKSEMIKRFGILSEYHEIETYTAAFRVMYYGPLWNQAIALLIKGEFEALWNLIYL